MGAFDGKVAFVTGASSGIGRATAIAFARAGASVGVCGRRRAEVEDTCSAAVAAGGRALPLLADIGDQDQVRAVFATLDQTFGRLDVAANCAGVDFNAAFLDYTAADFDRIFAANVKGLFLCLQQEILAMRRHGEGGAVVTVGSAAGHRPYPGNNLYNASKSTASMLTRSVAVECGPLGIRVNEVAPGPVLTPMLEGYMARETAAGRAMTAERLAAAVPLRRVASPEDIADVILFLCSPQAASITGAVLAADGGFVLA
jgi:NAD(P)-dependent dehydrogenase (short-subunit alcohol dehydrogenase family)